MIVVATGPAMKFAASMTRTPASRRLWLISAGRTISSAPGSRESGRIERPQIDELGGAVGDQLRHRQARGRRVENPPRPVAGRDEHAARTRNRADQGNAIVGDRTVARLPARDSRG